MCHGRSPCAAAPFVGRQGRLPPSGPPRAPSAVGPCGFPADRSPAERYVGCRAIPAARMEQDGRPAVVVEHGPRVVRGARGVARRPCRAGNRHSVLHGVELQESDPPIGQHGLHRVELQEWPVRAKRSAVRDGADRSGPECRLVVTEGGRCGQGPGWRPVSRGAAIGDGWRCTIRRWWDPPVVGSAGARNEAPTGRPAALEPRDDPTGLRRWVLLPRPLRMLGPLPGTWSPARNLGPCPGTWVLLLRKLGAPATDGRHCRQRGSPA